jgi:WD40 repeat protein/CHAT domain-containing protein
MSNTFTITIKKKDESYTIEAHGQKGIQVYPQPAPQLKNLLSDEQIKATLKSLANKQGVTTPHDIQKLGEALYNALFIQPILLAYGKAQGRAKNENGVRLRLRIEPPELATLPWETLHGETLNGKKDWLSTQSTTPLVRQLILEPGSKTLQKLQVRGALKILFVGASPKDLSNLNIEKTATELRKLLEESIKKKKIKIVFDVIPNATLDELRKELVKDYYILYFSGHGSPEGIFLDDGGGKLLKEGDKVVGREKGSKYGVSAQTLAKYLEGKQTRLVFLAACNTSTAPDESGLLAGFAQELAQRSELPAIVAMQYFISDRQANPLTTQFFAALAAGRPVDVALAEARKTLIKKETVGRDVFSPVLYLQAEDGVLFPKAKEWPVIVRNLVIGILLFSTSWLGLGIFSTYRINRITTSSEELFTSNNQLEALLESIRAGKHANNRFFIWIDAETRLQAGLKLQNMMNRVKEYNRWEGQKVLDISFNPKDGLMAWAGEDNTIKLGQPDGTIRILEGHTWSVTSVSFSPDGKLIASPGQNDTVRLWKLEEQLKILKSNQDLVNSVSFSPNGQLIASGNDDNTVKLWKSDGTLLHTLEGHSSGVNSISFSRNSQLIASTSWDNTIKIWDIEGNLIRTIDGSVRIQNGEVIHDVINSVSFSPVDGQLIASGHGDNTVKLWKTDGTLIRILKEPNQLSRFNFQVQLIRAVQPMVIEGHNDGVRDVSFSPNGELIASATQDNKIRLWKIDGYLESTLPGHNQTLWSLSFSPDGKLIASASSDNTIKIWKLKDGSLIRTLQGHQSLVRDVSFSPDGKLIASASNDNTVKLWRLKDGSLIDTFEGHDREVKSISFNPDGNTLASASYDGKLILWSLTPDNPLKRSCNWVKDYLNQPSIEERYKNICDDIGTQK